MKNFRIITCLDIKGPKLVKGIHLEDLRVLCKPGDFAKKSYRCGADAICIASLLRYSLILNLTILKIIIKMKAI